ncbi:hypothetical protein GCM10022243_00200 [Saccharothrix violaceirubra]
MQAGQGGPELPGPVASQRAGDQDVALGGRLDRRHQHGMRADLDEHAVARVDQAARGEVEQHRFTQVPVPVVGVELLGPLARDGREQRDHGRPGRHTGEVDPQPVAQRLDLDGVRRIVDRERAGPDVVGRALRQQPGQVGGTAGDHDRAGSVDHGDGEPPVPAGQVLGGVDSRERQGHHAALSGEGHQGLGTPGDDQRGVVQRQDARDVRGGDLALRVADDRVRHHAVRPPQPRQRHHHREQRGLDHVDAVERAVAQDVDQRPVHVGRQRGGAGVDVLAEHLRRRIQLTAHADPLRTLAGEDEDGAARHIDTSGDEVRCAPTGGQLREPGPVVGEDHGAVLEGRAAGQCHADGRVGRVHRAESRRVGFEGLAGARRQHPRHP